MDNESKKQVSPTLALRPREAARALGIGQRKLWELTKTGVIPSVRIGTCVLYQVSQLEAWLTARASKAGQE
ncbi:MAG: helix-turn-helix domain-containing protein [Planctomycetes bacterium]|nr:helix-turn-helix domain-containing protein [Planctomycetota bacterium]